MYLSCASNLLLSVGTQEQDLSRSSYSLSGCCGPGCFEAEKLLTSEYKYCCFAGWLKSASSASAVLQTLDAPTLAVAAFPTDAVTHIALTIVWQLHGIVLKANNGFE